MGNNLNKTLHLEFYGMTACGKSTVSHILAGKLRQDGFSVAEPNYDIVYGIGSLSRRLLKAKRTVGYSMRYPARTAEVKRIVEANGYKNIKQSLPQIVNIIQKLYIYTSKNTDTDICIWDQGIIQAAISLSVTGCISSAENEKRIIELLPGDTYIKKIYLTEDLPVIKERLNKRETNNSRIEKIKDEGERDKMLLIFEDACNAIKTDNGLVIDGRGDAPETVAERIKNALTLSQA